MAFLRGTVPRRCFPHERGYEVATVIRRRQHIDSAGIAHGRNGRNRTGFPPPSPRKRARSPHPDRIPPHVRHFQMPKGFVKSEAHGLCIHPAEPREFTLLAPAGHELHAQTDSEDGNFAIQHAFAQNGDKPRRAKVIDRMIEGPHPREDDFVSLPHSLRILGNQRLLADLLQHVPKRPEIPHSIVDDDDHRFLPL